MKNKGELQLQNRFFHWTQFLISGLFDSLSPDKFYYLSNKTVKNFILGMALLENSKYFSRIYRIANLFFSRKCYSISKNERIKTKDAVVSKVDAIHKQNHTLHTK